MRIPPQGPFSDECTTFFDREGITLLSHTARWSGAVQFAHAVARTADAPEASLLSHVADLVEPPVNSYAPERSVPPEGATAPTYNNSWYAVAYSSELTTSTPYSTRLFNEPLTLERTGEASVTTVSALDSSVRYVTADHQGLVYVWRGAAEKADDRMLPTHPTPEQTHTVETILDYGCDWKYIVEVRDREMRGDAGRYGEMRGDMG